jgi:hypothetical protein
MKTRFAQAVKSLSGALGAVALVLAAAAPGDAGGGRIDGHAVSFLAVHLPDALVASGPATEAQDRTVLKAVTAFDRRKKPDDFK